MKDARERIEELEAEVRSRGGICQINDGLDDETRESFLKDVLAFEEDPETTIREQFVARGYDMPRDLWELIARLAEMNIVIELTDHLDDATLFQRLLAQLDESTHVPGDAQTIMHIDMCNEEPEVYLRYYANEEDREHWRRHFPDEEIPPRERPPHDRDRLLPKAEDLRTAEQSG